ncbi:AMP-binding protein [Streptomyces sp. M10(2022)]
MAGRNRAEIEGLIGFFVNTLVIRSDLSGNPASKTSWPGSRTPLWPPTTTRTCPSNGSSKNSPPNATSPAPLFQVMFILQNAGDEAWEFTGLTTEPQTPGEASATFDLVMTMQETDEGLKAQLLYSTDLFDVPTMERLAGHYRNVLASVVAEPAARISDVQMLSEAEQHQLLVEWNDTAVPFPDDQCIHQLVEAHTAKQPDATALVFDDQHLTYAQLNAKANQLAHHLRTLGVGPDTLVGLCLDRGPDMITSLLAVLKAGGAYVPSTPNTPPNASRSCSPTQPHPSSSPNTISSTASPPPTATPSASTPTHSPGTPTPTPKTTPPRQPRLRHLHLRINRHPKGVMIRHSNAGNMVHALAREYGMHSGSRMLQFFLSLSTGRSSRSNRLSGSAGHWSWPPATS